MSPPRHRHPAPPAADGAVVDEADGPPWLDEAGPSAVFAERGRRIDPAAAAGLLGPLGPIALSLPGYEHRPEQLSMAAAVARAFNEDAILTAEAGTGTGKSLAYLVPAILWALENKDRVLVSTHTINLQEQLIHKDLPFLAAASGLEFGAAMAKGRGNYLCRRKAEQIRREPALLIEDDAAREMHDLLAWAATTRDGSLSDLPLRPSAHAWEQLASENDNCLRTKCPHHAACFFYAARRAAAAADVLVVNHHLLLADLALREETEDYEHNSVLPPASRIIIDEAHHLEDVATAHFGVRLSLAMIERSLRRLRSVRDQTRGILPALVSRLDAERDGEDAPVAGRAARWIEERLLPRAHTLGEQAEEAFASILAAEAALAAGRPEREARVRITPSVRGTRFWEEAVLRLSELGAAVASFAADCGGVLERLELLSAAGSGRVLFLATELRAHQGRLRALATALFDFVRDSRPGQDDVDAPDRGDPDGECRWMEVSRRPGASAISFHSAPVEVAPLLARSLFGRFSTVVLTSATLAVGHRFDFLHRRLGIDRLPEPERIANLRVESPFHYAEQCLLLVPSDLPEPDDPAYESATHLAMRDLLEIAGGGTFLLFTSYGALTRAHAALAPLLRERGFTPLRQGEANRHHLLARFAGEASAVLFATDSFWEGVDVRGDALRCVVIARLPFKVPSEPIEETRVELIRARGGNPFLDHALPHAVIKLRQGFGRLIRSREDRGCVAILDSRIVRKRYGEVLLDSLPPARRVVAPTRHVLRAAGEFFAAPVRSAPRP